MKEGHQFASPVFKKRFARRKTTHRPFTFARNFEGEGTTSAAQNQIVEQVGDRGVVITTPVRLPQDNEGLSITDIVRQSPVPVLIAHASPTDSQTEVTRHDEEEQLDTSLCRRSVRSREPSDKFLSRRQYPFGTPQHSSVHHTPDEHYIGSKNDSNIDAEVSFAGEDEHVKHIKKKKLASSSGSSKRANRTRTAQNSSTLETPAAHSKQGSDSSQPEGNTSNSVQPSARKASRKKTTAVSAETTVRGKAKEQPVLDKTTSPLPAKSAPPKGSSDRPKRAVPPKKKKSPPRVGSKDDLSVTESTKRGQNRSKLDASTASSALGRGNKSVNGNKNASVPLSAKEETGLAVEASIEPHNRAEPPFVKDSRRTGKKSKVSKEVNGDESHNSVSGREKTDILVSSSEAVSSSAASRRKRVTSNDDADSEASGPSPRKRGRAAILLEARTASSQKLPKTKQQPPPASSSQSAQRIKRKATRASSSAQDHSALDTKGAAANSGSFIHASPHKSRNMTQTLQKPCESPKRFFTDPERSPQKLVANKIVGVKATQRKGTTKASNSFWKTSRRISSELRPQRRQMNVSVSSVYDDDTFGGEDSELDSVAGSREVKANRASRAGHHRQRHGQSSQDSVEKKKKRKVLTELDVIISILDETEMQIVEDSGMSRACQSAVHKAFTFTRKQLQQTGSQLSEIQELTSRVNKLRTRCKIMSNESKENHHQKCILQKELQSLQSHGIDADMVLIDKWLQDFQNLRQSGM